MINSFYIVLITMLQVQTPLKIPWTLLSSFNLNGIDGLIYTFDYNPPENNESPQVLNISSDIHKLNNEYKKD